jgi:signal recognition particle subunit SRP54
MLPGAGQMKEALAQVDDKDLDRTAAIIRSMTPLERADPRIIKGSRRVRIANGSGVTVTEVNGLVERFFEARKMMTQMAGGMGMPGARSMSKKAKGRQQQLQARKSAKGKKGKKRGGQARQPGVVRAGDHSGGSAAPGQDLNQLLGASGLPPGMQLPDLSALRFGKKK